MLAKRTLDEEAAAAWLQTFQEASTALSEREQQLALAASAIETKMEYVGVTAVEDKLQEGVPKTIEQLQRANIKIWMLTGDKLETAWVIAQNASLVQRQQAFYTIGASSPTEARHQLHGYPQGAISAPCLILDGASLDVCVEHFTSLFIEVACAAPTVVVCRCSPTHSARARAEQEAELYAEDLTPAWKRVVQGVREMCDVCGICDVCEICDLCRMCEVCKMCDVCRIDDVYEICDEWIIVDGNS